MKKVTIKHVHYPDNDFRYGAQIMFEDKSISTITGALTNAEIMEFLIDHEVSQTEFNEATVKQIHK